MILKLLPQVDFIWHLTICLWLWNLKFKSTIWLIAIIYEAHSRAGEEIVILAQSDLIWHLNFDIITRFNAAQSGARVMIVKWSDSPVLFKLFVSTQGNYDNKYFFSNYCSCLLSKCFAWSWSEQTFKILFDVALCSK